MYRKQLKEDGTTSDEFLITEEFIAMLDFYVASSLSGKLSDAVELRPFYEQRVAVYKALNGQNGVRDWRPLLLEQLQQWLSSFPESVNKRKNRLSVSSSATQRSTPAVSADDL